MLDYIKKNKLNKAWTANSMTKALKIRYSNINPPPAASTIAEKLDRLEKIRRIFVFKKGRNRRYMRNGVMVEIPSFIKYKLNIKPR